VRSYDRQGRLVRQTDPAADLAAGNGNRLSVFGTPIEFKVQPSRPWVRWDYENH